MKKFLVVLTVTMVALCGVMQAEKPLKEATVDEMKSLVGVITTNFGVIKVQFYPDEAPNTCRNFINLANKKFYDNLTIHRIVKDFMIQGGCPTGDGTGGPGYAIKAEFNKIKHVPGVLSMARSQDPDSAGSQFFICQGQPSPFLDGKYTAFGHVVEGLDVVDKIASTPVNGQSPVQKVIIKSIVIEKIAKEAPKTEAKAPVETPKPDAKAPVAPAGKKE